MTRDYYAILEVERTADDKTLKSSYRRLAMANHPDRNPGNTEADARIREITVAYGVLADPQKRAAYDRFGHAAFESTGSRSSTDFRDIFNDIFGGVGTPGDRRRPEPPRDPHADLFRAFNNYTSERDAEALLAVLNADPQLAAHFLSKLSAYKLQQSCGKRLRVRLAELAPDAYSNAVAALEIDSFNSAAYDSTASSLVNLLKEFPHLADRYIREIGVKSLKQQAGRKLRAQLAKVAPLTYRDKMLSACVKSFNDYPFGEDADVLLELLAQDPKLAERYLRDLSQSSLAKGSGVRIGAELAKLRPEAYRDKMVPECIVRFNSECEDVDAGTLLKFLDGYPQLASQYLRDIRVGALTSWRGGKVSKNLRSRLAELEPQAYRDNMVPHFIDLLNGHSSKETAATLLAFLEQDPQLAGQYLRGINPSRLEYAGNALNERLEALEPQAYRDAMVPRYIGNFNSFSSTSTADILSRFLDQDETLAARYVAEIDGRTWNSREAKSLIAKVATLTPQAYLEREVASAISSFNSFASQYSQADLLRFLGQEPSLADRYRCEIRSDSLDSRDGAVLKSKLAELTTTASRDRVAGRPEKPGMLNALIDKTM